MSNFLLGLICGGVMGGSTVLYVTFLTRKMQYEKRIRIIKWVGIPAGITMALLAQVIGSNL